MLDRKSKNLEALAVLADNWDGYQGKKPTDAALKTASEVWFVPVNDGGVQIEMHSGGANIEIAINPNGTVEGIYSGKP